ncbi:MAG TPA: peptide deformylase, partial [Erysipelotrichaceae bacterium]|nr:peptide deformylase [Erysipelotrichaceae bacterium]
MITMKDIITDQDPRIREISKEVELPLSDEDRNKLMEMMEYLKNSQDEELSEKYHLRPGVGLAAIQLGIPKRMLT